MLFIWLSPDLVLHPQNRPSILYQAKRSCELGIFLSHMIYWMMHYGSFDISGSSMPVIDSYAVVNYYTVINDQFFAISNM